MIFRPRHKGSGFTLIEIIITMMIISVLGTMIYTFFLNAFSDSVVPITRLRASAALHKVMANITADYNRYPRWRSETNYSTVMLTYVIPTNFNGHYYRLESIPGSGTSSAPGFEPVWPLSSGGTVTDNTITWKEWGRLRVDNGVSPSEMPLTTLKSQIRAQGSEYTNNYGKYTVVKNGFIQFDASGNEIDDATLNKILKVTLKNETGETLTALFFDEGL